MCVLRRVREIETDRERDRNREGESSRKGASSTATELHNHHHLRILLAVVHGGSRRAPCRRGEEETTKEMKVHPPLSSFTVVLASPSSMAELTELSSLPCSQPPLLGSAWLRNTNKKENCRAQPLLSRNHRISVRRKRHRFHRNLPLQPLSSSFRSLPPLDVVA
ncbi:hypothetical protein PIB30_063239 [Stylosanthes scabra]|uniref:Uncharacterized protein n=1 Tax=Stylosanthes scabra TaxID=79078 RepID=A0ABU6WP63_9FABA|nr:hypothetical protein [Stylosanthes scabra]